MEMSQRIIFDIKFEQNCLFFLLLFSFEKMLKITFFNTKLLRKAKTTILSKIRAKFTEFILRTL